MSRKKTVYSVSNLIHMFCNQVDCNGYTTNKTSNGVRQAFVENDVMFSYGYHYPMAQWHKNALLICSNKSSVTTEKHKYRLSMGVPDPNLTFYVPNVRNPLAEENIEHLKDHIIECISRLLGRSYDTFERLEHCIDTFNSYAGIFGITKFELSDDWSMLLSEICKQKTEQRKLIIKRQEEKRLKEYEELRLKELANLGRWINGEIDCNFYYLDLDFIRIKGDVVQTTRGVTIPLNVAKRAYWALCNNMLKVGEKIEHYEVREINDDLLKIGCHKLSISQVKECFNK